MARSLLKVSRSQQYSITMRLLKEQGGNCLVCKKRINVKTTGRASDYTLDHSHSTGEVRGVLHRSCNSAEGRVRHSVSRWGAKGNDEEAIIEYLEGLAKYLRECHEGTRTTGLMYPNHKTPEEKAAAAKVKRRKRDAAKRAAASVKKRQQSKGNS